MIIKKKKVTTFTNDLSGDSFTATVISFIGTNILTERESGKENKGKVIASFFVIILYNERKRKRK